MAIKKFLSYFCFAILASIIISNKVSAAPTSVRFGGQDRYETSVEVSRNNWNQSDYVILVSGENFPDAITAAPLAKKYSAPILITEGKALNAKVYSEIERLKAKHIFIVGGSGVVLSKVEQDLMPLNADITRISGQDRYETSKKVAEQIGSDNGVVIASGENFPDALSIASIAASKQMPILLTTSKELPNSIKDFINNNNINKYYVVGGTFAVSENAISGLSNVKRLSGLDRYKTNISVINEFISDLNFQNVYIALGENFPDALCGSAAAAKDGAPIVLSNFQEVEAKPFINSKIDSISTLKILGGNGGISDSLVKYILASNNLVLGYSTYYYQGDKSSYNSMVNYHQFIDEIATDTYATDGLGNLSGNVPYDQLNFANNNKIATYAMISNYFDGNIAKTLLESSTNRQRLINNIVTAIKDNNYKGVNIDLEGIYYYNRDQFTTFMKDLYNTLNPQGYKVTIAVPAKTKDNISDGWTGAYDYKKIAEFSDEIILMTYDEHWSGGSAGAIASIGWVQKVIDYSVTVIPKYKIILGLAAYAYDWPSNGSKAASYSINEAYNRASKYGSQVKWDSVSKNPYFNYTDGSGIYHTVWFENAESISYKLDIVNNYKLSGVSIWRLGLENYDYWQMIKTKLNK